MNDFKITIITVCFNSEKTLRDTIESVKHQTYHNIEYIVVDGGSTDKTNQIISEYKDIVSVHISEPDKGLYDAMNKGIANSTGDIIGILNSDDVFANEVILQQIAKQFVQLKEIDVVFADVGFYNYNLEKKVRHYSSAGFSQEKLKYGIMPAHPSLYVKRAIALSVGDYSLNYKIAADFDFIVRLFTLPNLRYAYVQQEVVKMRVGGLSTAGFASNLLLNKEILQSLRSNGLFSFFPLLLVKYPKKILGFLKK